MGIIFSGSGVFCGGTTETSAPPSQDGNISLIKSYMSNDGSWYRLYSDGWCEQGGYYKNTHNTHQTIVKMNILLPYRDLSYRILINPDWPDNLTYEDFSALFAFGYNVKYLDGISINIEPPFKMDGFDWYAVGYVSESIVNQYK